MKLVLVCFLVCCVVAAFADTEAPTIRSSFDIIQRGAHCLQVAKNVIDAVDETDTEEALADLVTLKADSRHLSTHAKSAIKQLEENEAALHQDLVTTERKLGQLAQSVSDLQKKVNTRQAALDMESKNLIDYNQQVKNSKEELQRAESRLHDAKKKARRRRRRRGILGAVVGFATGGLGGALVGGAAGALSNQLEGDIKRAKNRISEGNTKVRQAEETVTRARQQISDLKDQIQNLSKEREHKEKEQHTTHETVSRMKNAIVFQKQAAEIWDLLLQSTEDADNQTELLAKVVTMAYEEKDWNIVRSDGTKLIASSFLEAWKDVETSAKNTGSYYDQFLIE